LAVELLQTEKNSAIREQRKNIKDTKDTGAPRGDSMVVRNVKWYRGTKDSNGTAMRKKYLNSIL